MEALWNLEDKWELTTKEALLLLGCTSLLIIGFCTATILKKAQRKQVMDQDEATNGSKHEKWYEPGCNWVAIKRMLMCSVRWSRANKWEERSIVFGHDSGSPVWQRPILMGEKCKLPRFSGLILYDETGRLLEHSLKETSHNNDIHQEKPAAVVRTTLKDLL
ncbi:hypothetical protein ACOSP7_031112 [Xanthoceras sorbifolium]|uniref:Transmembrane protein n=1 Tax=Xanthoceras sorbifolium TaxID=99658 RepID=A0ABQ8H178_9ROSI|nr:hypothetical protein JRO89_XS15G0071900 [Xanthoceras sorbifolium]